jgi:hypothetical protein
VVISARLNVFTSQADILAQFINKPARELNELSHFSKTNQYAYHLRLNLLNMLYVSAVPMAYELN